ncbi:Di-copper centre-containing protein [Massarina eburnea CBS 473.64]|uniref:tyrosinase n=1 Tax=Massarina eburnea CBS 473.64 TaxID=1395130 RepID=A0A6A6S6N2_9PLEO|nr:Di-copper centre-containing protein [Massarina eburnea CBS 473.64]
MKATSICVASLFMNIGYASPIAGRDASEIASYSPFIFEKRQGPGSYYAITGATGGVHPRVEIRDLEKAGGEMWNLFLLAMTAFQAMDQGVLDSYYQIAGIHGMPWTSWDGVEGSGADISGSQMGYCPHGQALFGTWHRPYLILFENLQKVAASIANTFPDATRDKYQDAATKIRIPYWDWAKSLPTDQPVVPTFVSTEKATVTFPNGTTASIDNPLYDYNFHPLDHTQINGTGCTLGTGPSGGLPSVCDNSLQTIRAALNASDHDALNRNLRRDLTSRRASLYAVLSQYQTFTQVISAQTCATLARVGNLESIHNPIHNAFFPGHMSPSSVAAYDPIFWFHHANVDRQIALFQAVFPDTYLESCEAATATYTIQTGTSLDSNSALTPFHKNAAGDFWTSSSSRNIVDLGYTYPELANGATNESIVASIKAQYSGPSDILVTTSKTQLQSSTTAATELYLAEVKLPLYGLDDGDNGAAPYNVLLFLGEPKGDSNDWAFGENFIGTVSSLGGRNIQMENTTPAPIDLSATLAKAISAGVTTNEKAKDYLKTNLKYRLELGGVEIEKAKVSALKIYLISTEVEIAQSDDTFDRWVGGFKEHGRIEG